MRLNFHVHQTFPNGGIVTIDEASHWMHTDAAEEFYQMVTRFLWAEGHWS